MTARSDAATTVLLIENKPVARTSMTVFLSEAGFNVIQADSLPEAWKTLETQPEAGVLLADLDTANGTDGLGVARKVHERWPSVGLVITSGQVRRLPPAEIPGNGCFLPLPLPAETLLHEVRVAAHQIAA